MAQIIAFTNDANKVSILSPSLDSGLALEQIAQKDIPDSRPYIIINDYELPDRDQRDRWKIEGDSVIIDDSIPVVREPNWDMLYGRLLAYDLKPIFESIKAIAKTDTAINWDLTALAEALSTVRTEQALKDCLDELVEDGYAISSEHKLLWNNAITELNFSDLVRLR